MEQKEFIEKYSREKSIFEEWGTYVKECIIDRLKGKTNIDNFFKMDVNPRIKTVDSLLEKAFHRGKNYIDPYSDIEDKVGIRFVVLYLEDIQIISKVIESIDVWDFSKDKDFNDEINKDPEKFGYESLHYVVKSKQNIKINNILIPVGVPCEIQIRTLLQHAYCEMAHSTSYKKNVHSTVKRVTARSMALIESADYMFREVRTMVQSEEKNYSELLPRLEEYYRTISPLNMDYKTNEFIIDNYRELLNDNTFDKIKNFIEEKSYLKNRITTNYNVKLIYRQPIVLLLYYLISQKRNTVSRLWPLTDDELIPLYNDLGFSLN